MHPVRSVNKQLKRFTTHSSKFRRDNYKRRLQIIALITREREVGKSKGYVYMQVIALITRDREVVELSLIHISEPTRRYAISYAVFCLKKKN